MKNQHYTVTRDSKPQFRGSDFECFEYILKHQPNSVDHATRYEGWKINKTSLEGIIIGACLMEEGYENATIAQAVENASNRFHAECGWNIEREGLLKSVQGWLQGLALSVPYWNGDVDEMGFDPDCYWERLARSFVGMTETNAPDQELCEAIEAL